MRRVLAVLCLVASVAAHAEPSATVRVGSYRGFGRVVFELPAPTSFHVSQSGARVLVTFGGGGAIGMPDAVPRNVVSILGGDQSATLTIAPGARIRSARVGNRVMIDVLDPVARPHATPSATTAPAPAATAPSAPTPEPVGTSTPPTPPTPVTRAPPVTPAPVEPVQPAASQPEPQPAAAAPAPLRIPAAATVGAAAFRRGELGLVVFDDRVAIDPGELERAGFAGATLREAGRFTMLSVPLGADAALDLQRDPAGWTVTSGTAGARSTELKPVPDGIAFPFAAPGRVIAIEDPSSGQTLLIGTSRGAGEAGGAVVDARRAPGYSLLPTWLGVALEPSSDQVALRASLSGFTLVTPDANSSARAAASVPESRFGLPNAPAPALARRLDGEIAAAAAAPPRARGQGRVAAARTMLSLGMASEAYALLTLAAEEDPTLGADPQVAALSGIAAVLAGRPGEAKGLDAPGLEAGDEVLMWRGLRDAADGKPATGLARAVDVALLYPEAIQRRILPTVVEAAVADGQSPFANERLAQAPSLGFARGLQAERDGKVEEALKLYDALDQSRDVADSVRGATAAAELRLAQTQITPAEAADIFARQALRWRGDARELANRLRTAELRVRAGQWRAALDGLRDTEGLFPSAASEINARKAGVFRELIAAPRDRVSPLEIVTLAGDYADCVPAGADGEAVAALLAHELIALDLPSRAVPVLQRLADGARSAATKAEFATALAQLYLDLGEPAKAEASLQKLTVAELSSERAEQRQLLLARARAAQGDARGAADILAALASPEAAELRASLAAQAGDWPGNLRALADLAAKRVPQAGALDDSQQDIVLREAVAAVQAGDGDALHKLEPFAQRLTGPRADQFRMLTAAAVRSTSDLPRAAGELALSRSFSARLDSPRTP
jgi:hypothetical protein